MTQTSTVFVYIRCITKNVVEIDAIFPINECDELGVIFNKNPVNIIEDATDFTRSMKLWIGNFDSLPSYFHDNVVQLSLRSYYG